MEAAAARAYAQDTQPGYKWNVLVIVMIGTFMSILDSSIVNVSIPAIMADFGVGVSDIQWTMTGYMLAYAGLMPLTAWLRDRIGYKAIFASAMFIFTIGSLLCGLAWNLPVLIFARVIQALGGGALSPTGMAMITEVFPRQERAKAMGVLGVGMMLGPALGPTLGGYLTHGFGWRWIFLVNLPIGIIGVIAALEMLAPDRPHRLVKRPFDAWGFLFLTVFLVSLLLGLSKGEDEGWTSRFIVTCFILAGLSITGFILAETHTKERIMDISLFKIPVFATASMVSVMRSVALFGGTFLIPLFVQQQMGYNELQSGLMLLPSSLLLMAVIPVISKMSDRVPARPFAVAGLGLLTYFMFVFSKIDVNTSAWGIIWPTLVRSIAMAMLMAPIMTITMNCVPQEKIAMASSMTNIIQQVGGTIGIAFFGTTLTNRAKYHMSIVSQAMQSGTPEFAETVRNTMHHIHGLGFTYSQSSALAQSMVMKKVSQAAVVMSFQDTFLIGAFLMASVIIFAFMLPHRLDQHVAKNTLQEKETAMETTAIE